MSRPNAGTRVNDGGRANINGNPDCLLGNTLTTSNTTSCDKVSSANSQQSSLPLAVVDGKSCLRLPAIHREADTAYAGSLSHSHAVQRVGTAAQGGDHYLPSVRGSAFDDGERRRGSTAGVQRNGGSVEPSATATAATTSARPLPASASLAGGLTSSSESVPLARVPARLPAAKTSASTNRKAAQPVHTPSLRDVDTPPVTSSSSCTAAAVAAAAPFAHASPTTVSHAPQRQRVPPAASGSPARLRTAPLHLAFAAKEYAHDELVDMKLYLRSVKATTLFRGMTKDLERDKPEDPVSYLLMWLLQRRRELEEKTEAESEKKADVSSQ